MNLTIAKDNKYYLEWAHNNDLWKVSGSVVKSGKYFLLNTYSNNDNPYPYSPRIINCDDVYITIKTVVGNEYKLERL